MADQGATRGMSLIAQSADIIGTVLLVLMVVIVCWKAYSLQPVANADAFVGLLGLFAICIPILAEVSFEGLGLKLAAKLKQEQAQVNSDYDSDFADLKKRVHDLETQVSLASAFTQTATASATGGPVTGGIGANGGLPTAPATSSGQALRVFIFFADSAGFVAKGLERKLIESGYEATSRFSSLEEVAERQAPGQIRVVRRPSTPAGEIEKIRQALLSIESITEDRIVVRGQPLDLRSGDIQIQLF